MNEHLGRTSFERACAGYDAAFEHALVAAITEAIGHTSITTDQNIMAVRTAETISALATVMAATLAMCPSMDTPSNLRRVVDELAKRIRKDAARGRAEGIGDFLGAAKGGHA